MSENTLKIRFEDILDLAIEKNASDLHVSVDDPIALRIYGKLHFVEQKVDQNQMEEMIDSFLTETQKKLLAEQKKLYFTYPYGEKMRFRVSVFFQLGKLSLAIHTIDQMIVTLENLGIADLLQDLLILPSGLILVTGEHNNGVSTTVRAILQNINENQPRHVFTIENPVEHYFQTKKALFSQCEIFNDADSYKKALDIAFDVDADIVMVDNAYGFQRFQTILNLAETGHLVIAVLPKASVVSALDSVVNLFPTEQHSYIQSKLGGCLKGVLSQKMVKRGDQEGVIPVFEMLTMNSTIVNLIKSGSFAQLKNVMQAGIKQGMITMELYARHLLEAGYITQEVYNELAQED